MRDTGDCVTFSHSKFRNQILAPHMSSTITGICATSFRFHHFLIAMRIAAALLITLRVFAPSISSGIISARLQPDSLFIVFHDMFKGSHPPPRGGARNLSTKGLTRGQAISRFHFFLLAPVDSLSGLVSVSPNGSPIFAEIASRGSPCTHFGSFS